MAREVYVAGQRLRLEDSDILGQGGEAEVFDLRPHLGQALALKLWKPPDHVDFQGSDEEARRNREAAASRMAEYAEKLRAFPKGLPVSVITPEEIARSRSGTALGYTMKLLDGVEQLRRYGTRDFRDKAGITTEMAIQVLMDLHRTVGKVHDRNVVIGDFNYMNVLVRGLESFLIDADSMQFGRFFSRAFTARFVDPLICDPLAKSPIQAKPHSETTDWYAYALMVFELLMYVPLYGGVYEPKDRSRLCGPDARPLKRISVFNKEVIYPRKAVPLTWLPARASDYFGRLVTPGVDERGEFPFDLLEVLQAHAQGRYIDPAKAVTPPMKAEVIRGRIRSRRVYSVANGMIVASALQGGALRLLVSHDEAFEREDGGLVFNGQLNPAFKFRLSSSRTLAGIGSQLAVIEAGQVIDRQSVDLFQGRRAVFDANASHYYWLSQGNLYRDDRFGPRQIGSVLQNQTLFWVGPAFGFGFYRVSSDGKGGFTVGFVFDAEKKGLNDQVTLPPIKGELLDAACYFSSNRCWFLTTTHEGTKTLNRCLVIRPDGSVSQGAMAEDGDGSWLSSIRGKCAATVADSAGNPAHRLFAATDNGLVALDEVSGQIVERSKYPDTADFVDPEDRLFYDHSGGLLVATRNEVRLVSFV